jgi:hypothetical protein
MRLALQRAQHCACVCLLALIFTPTLRAVDPQLNDISPYGFQRGTEVEVEFKGARLKDAQEALFYSPGFTVQSWEVTGDSAVKAKLAIAPDCRLGMHALRLRAASGISNLRLFSVGALPEVPEVEPNNLFDQPQSIPTNVTVTGIVQSEDVEYFVVEAKQGERITAEIEGLRLGYTMFDPYVAILNEKRFELARSDDAALVMQDCVAAIIAPEDGKYIIQVRESAYGGDGNSKYRLHVGNFPRPRAVYPGGGRPGETLAVKCLGDIGGEFAATINLPATGASEFPFVAQDERGLAPSPNVVRVVDLPNVLEQEPNNDAKAVTTVSSLPAAFNGIIEQKDDIDFFKFAAKKGEQYEVRVFARNILRSPLDSVLSIHRADGGQIAANDDNAGSPDSYLRFAVPEDGEYLVAMRDHLNSGGPTYVYRVEVAPLEQVVTVSLPERQQYVPTILNVPRGNRMALMVNANRQGFGGDLGLELRNGPAGLAVEPLPLTASTSSVPVIFSAPPQATPAGALAELAAPPVDANLKIPSRFAQRTMLIRGQNNRDVYGHDAERMAVAIVEQIPFELELIPPAAPLVREGSIELKVIAKRQGEFKAPISVTMLYNPSGVGSSGSISIPEGQSEVVIPLTANNAAAIGTHKIVVVGRAAHDGGTVECSTQFVDLNVADSFYNIAFQKAAVEQGQETEVVIKVEKKADFPDNAKIELVGLPAGTSTEPLTAASGAESYVFKVKSDAATSKPGKYTSLVCRSTFTINGMNVVQTQGGGELRIDAPLPPKVNQPAQPAPEKVAAAPAQPEQPKRLSRLEMLRQQKEAAQGEK